MERQIFLARNGKTTGPYNEQQILEMTESGELYKYEWIWDGESPDWTPVPKKGKSPPPKPDVTVTKIELPESAIKEPIYDIENEDSSEEIHYIKPTPSHSTPQHQPKQNKFSTSGNQKQYSAILYDHEKSFAGKVSKTDGTHARFLTETHHHPFKIGQVVWIDLLHDEKDMAYKLRSAVEDVKMISQNAWEMTLFIDQFPI